MSTLFTSVEEKSYFFPFDFGVLAGFLSVLTFLLGCSISFFCSRDSRFAYLTCSFDSCMKSLASLSESELTKAFLLNYGSSSFSFSSVHVSPLITVDSLSVCVSGSI